MNWSRIALPILLVGKFAGAQAPAPPASPDKPTSESTAAQKNPEKPAPVNDPRSQADRIRAAMSASLASQRASIRKQAEAVGVKVPLMEAHSDSQPFAGVFESSGWYTASAPISTRSFEMPGCDPVPTSQLLDMISDAAHRQNVDPALVREVARQESGFHPCVVSPKGAQGVMQLMPETAMQFDVTDPFDANQNVEAGTKLLKQLLDRYQGDLPLALSAYNAGATRVDKAGGIPEIPETKNYVMSILGRFLQ